MAKFIPLQGAELLSQLRTLMRPSVQFGLLFPSLYPVGGSTVGRAASVRVRGTGGPEGLQTTAVHRQEAEEGEEASRVPGAGPHSQGHTWGF